MDTLTELQHRARLLLFIRSLVIVLGCTSGAARANLISNGSFEEAASGRSGWSWHRAADVPGWHGDNIEIWERFGGIGAYHGDRHAELNAHPGDGTSFTIYQDIPTTIGTEYSLSFAYGARRSDREAFLVEFADQSLLIDDHVVNQWSVFEDRFIARSASTRLAFTTVTPSAGTMGNFLDAISLENVSAEVRSPTGVSLLCAGLVGLFIARRCRR